MGSAPEWLLEAAEARRRMSGLGFEGEDWRRVVQARTEEFARLADLRLKEMSAAGLFGALSQVHAEVDETLASQGAAVVVKAKAPSGFYRKVLLSVEKQDALEGFEPFWKKIAFETLAVDAECSNWRPAPGADALVEEREMLEDIQVVEPARRLGPGRI